MTISYTALPGSVSRAQLVLPSPVPLKELQLPETTLFQTEVTSEDNIKNYMCTSFSRLDHEHTVIPAVKHINFKHITVCFQG